MRSIVPWAALALLVAACQAGPAEAPDLTPDPTPDRTEAPAPSPTPTEEPEATPTEEPDESATAERAHLHVADEEGVGEYVVDEDGLTLYVFLSDIPGMSHCTGQCADNWPPFVIGADEEPAAVDDVSAELDTIERADGSRQVTLDGWPLYYFAADADPGDIRGEGVGDVWFVARPDGSLPNQGPDGASDSAEDDYGY